MVILFARSVAAIVASLALLSGIWVLRSSEVTDDFAQIERQLLHSESFDIHAMAATMLTPAVVASSECDTHTQIALTLIEMRLAEDALRAGATPKFEAYANSLQERAERGLSCAPYTSFLWLAAFSTRLARGQLGPGSLKFLAMSYKTSPFEAWIMIRRLSLVAPLTAVVPSELRAAIEADFLKCVSEGFAREAARSYAKSPAKAQELLRAQLDKASTEKQSEFWNALKDG